MSDYLVRDWLREMPVFMGYEAWEGLRSVAQTSRLGVADFIAYSGLRGRLGVKALARDWAARRLDEQSLLHTRRDDIVDYCAAATSLEEAVRRACLSIRPNGKLHNHQSRVPKAVRQRLAAALLRSGPATTVSARAGGWDLLWRWVHGVGSGEWGVGPVFIYDVATRIGAYLSLYPSAVYLKAGTLAGTRALANVPGLHRPVYDVAFKTGAWMPVRWYRLMGMLPVIRYGESGGVGCTCAADALEDALCTLREAFVALRFESEGEGYGDG